MTSESRPPPGSSPSLRVVWYEGPSAFDPNDLRETDPQLEVVSASDREGLDASLSDGADCLLCAADRASIPALVEAVSVPVVATVTDGERAARAIERGAADAFRTDGEARPSVLAQRIRTVTGSDADSGTSGTALSLQRETDVEQVLSRVDEAFMALDDDWTFTYVNRRAAEMVDREPEDLIGTKATEQFPEAEGLAFSEEIARAVETQDPVTFEEYYPPLSLWIEVSAYPDPEGISVFLRDVTGRVEREDRLRRLLEATRDLMSAATPQAVMETASRAAREVLDFPGTNFRRYDAEAEVLESVALGATVDDVEDRPSYDVTDSPHGRAFRSGEIVVDDIGDEDPFDREVFEQTMYVPVGDYGVLSTGVIDGEFDAADRQLTELLATTAEVALARAERRERLLEYERTLEAAAGMVYSLDEDGRFTLVSSSLADRLGYDRDELVGVDVNVVLDDDGLERRHRTVQQLLATDDDGGSFETEYVTADGDRFPVEVELAAIRDDDEAFAGTVGVVKDITELEAARERVERERNRFTYLFENLPDPVVETEVVDGNPIARQVNPAFESVFGYDADRIVGENLEEFILPRDGHTDERSLDHPIDADETATREVLLETADGSRHFLYRGVAFEDDTDAGFVIYTDVTDRKRREQYLQVIGRVLRHNLRNDAGTIGGYAELVAEAVEDPTVAEYATAIRETAVGIANLSENARELQSVLGTVDEERVPVDAGTAVESAVDRNRERYRDADFTVDVPETLPVLAGEHLERVVDHLVENAVEHGATAGQTPGRPDGGEQMEPPDQEADDPRVRVTARDEGSRVVIGVADDGPGLPEQERTVVTGDGKISQVEHGSGLGLWFVRLVTRAYGGDVDLEESEWGGTEVLLRFEAA